MNATSNPDLIAFLNAARAGGAVNLQRAVDNYVLTAIEFATPELRDGYLNRWFDDHAGNSLFAWLENNIIVKVQEMSTADADVLHVLDRTGTLIVATWLEAS